MAPHTDPLSSPSRHLASALALTLASAFLSSSALCPLPSPSALAQDSPVAQASKKLSAVDAKSALELHKQVDRLQRAGKFDEAVAPAKEILALCEHALGPDHWQTADARQQIKTLEHMASLPEEGRKAIASVGALNDQRSEMYQKARYAEAERMSRELVAIYQRWLGADWPETAQGYSSLADALYSQGKHAEADSLYRKALAIRIKTLGEDHPRTAEGFNGVAYNLDSLGKYVEAEPLHRRALAIRIKSFGEDHADTAQSLNNLAFNIDYQGRYAEAESLFRKALAIWIKTLGEDHDDTALGYNNVAYNLDHQGRYIEAEPLHRRALAIRTKILGEDHADIAQSLNNLAANLTAQGKYAEAEPLHRRAQAIFLKIFGEDHPAIATVVANAATNLDDEGKHAEAEPLHRRALAIFLKTLGGDHPDTATAYTHVASNLDFQGKYEEAEPLFRRALAIFLKALGETHQRTATGYNELALNLDWQGKYDEAEPMYRKALAIQLQVKGANPSFAARDYCNLSLNLQDQGKYAEVEPLLEEALAIQLRVLGPDHPHTALTYNNLAFSQNRRGKYAEAESLFQKAQAIWLQVLGADHFQTALGYSNIAHNLNAQGRYAEAIRSWKTAVDSLERSRIVGNVIGMERSLLRDISIRPYLALALANQHQDHDAWHYWEADLARGLLDDLSQRQLRPLTPDQRRRETDLRGQLQRTNEHIGRLRAKATRTQDEDQLLDNLGQQRGTLRGQIVALENEVNAQYHTFVGTPATLDEIRATLPADTALIGWVDLDPKGPPDQDRSPYHWACVVRRDGEPLWIRSPGTASDRTWTKEDDQRPEALRKALRNKTPTWLDLAGVLARQRLDPLKPHLKGINHLIVLPSSALAGIPIETLVAAWPGAQGRFVVSYAPSGSMYARLVQPRSEREPSPTNLLALGDPAYSPTKPEAPAPKPPDHGIAVLAVVPNGNADLYGVQSGDVLMEYNGIVLNSATDLKTVPAQEGAKRIPVKLWRNGEVRGIEVAAGPLGIQFDPQRKAADLVWDQRESAAILKPLTRSEDLVPLPGTRREVELISSLFPAGQITTLLGEQATESAVQQLARSEKLKRYRFLHFATHGKSNPNVAMSSTLFLAPEASRSADPVALIETDGQITAEQIVNTWDLDADLVTLSACETGLGRYAGGEGYLGFTQALFVKGARSVVLSLWKVDDEATSLLMRRFYENLLGKREGLNRPMPKAESLAEAKSWLRELTVARADQELASLTRSVPRKPRTGPPTTSGRRFDHPYYWAAFILIGDPN